MPNSTCFGSISSIFTSRGGTVQHALDHGVGADRFTGAGGACDQKMRHLGKVGQHDAAADIPPSATVSLLFALENSVESISSRRQTLPQILFGTSMPTAALPGMEPRSARRWRRAAERCRPTGR